MTDKEKVLKKYPKAKLVRSCHGTYWQCSTKEWEGGRVIGEGALPFQAWADAAKSLRRA